jgi:hypothetical protein
VKPLRFGRLRKRLQVCASYLRRSIQVLPGSLREAQRVPVGRGALPALRPDGISRRFWPAAVSIQLQRILVFEHSCLPFEKLTLIVEELLLIVDKPRLLRDQVFLPIDKGLLIGNQFREL